MIIQRTCGASLFHLVDLLAASGSFLSRRAGSLNAPPASMIMTVLSDKFHARMVARPAYRVHAVATEALPFVGP
jgi:hypothetical protein